jgi:hypothetical protein
MYWPGWETFASPAWETPFPPNHSLTCLRVRGGPHTRSLILEWAERDGSRWIATLEITPEWRSYTLAPEAFKAWQPPAGRGGPGDRLNVTDAVRFTVRVATSHHAIVDPRQEYWIDELGTAPNPFGDAAAPPDFQPPHLESLCPGYQFFDVTTRVQVQPSHEKMAIEPWERRDRVDDWAFEPAYAVRAIHPRPRGIGFDQGRPWRWEPLLGAYDPRSPRVVPWRADDPNLIKFAGVDALPAEMPHYRGALAMLLVHVEPPYRGGVWAGFTPSEPHFFQQPLVTQALRQVLERMRRGLFLVEGGTDPITVPGRIVENAGERYVRDEGEVRLGARVINAGKSPARVEVVGTLGMAWNPGTLGGFRKELTLVPGQVEAVQGTVWVGDTTVAEIDLYSANDPADLARIEWLDALRHDAKVWYPGYPHGPCLDGEPEFVRLVPGGFEYRGEPWKAHGVNYMPSSGIGLNQQTWFEHWLGRGAYDPSVIQRDLERIRSLGFNSVSAFIYYRSLDAGHLFDFLRRCEALGLLVNLSLRPGTPMDFRWPEMKAMIEHYQLASHPTVMAYDLAWEPSHYDEIYQRRHPGFATPSCPFSGPRWAIMCGMNNAWPHARTNWPLPNNTTAISTGCSASPAPTGSSSGGIPVDTGSTSAATTASSIRMAPTGRSPASFATKARDSSPRPSLRRPTSGSRSIATPTRAAWSASTNGCRKNTGAGSRPVANRDYAGSRTPTDRGAATAQVARRGCLPGEHFDRVDAQAWKQGAFDHITLPVGRDGVVQIDFGMIDEDEVLLRINEPQFPDAMQLSISNAKRWKVWVDEAGRPGPWSGA